MRLEEIFKAAQQTNLSAAELIKASVDSLTQLGVTDLAPAHVRTLTDAHIAFEDQPEFTRYYQRIFFDPLLRLNQRARPPYSGRFLAWSLTHFGVCQLALTEVDLMVEKPRHQLTHMHMGEAVDFAAATFDMPPERSFFRPVPTASIDVLTGIEPEDLFPRCPPISKQTIPLNLQQFFAARTLRLGFVSFSMGVSYSEFCYAFCTAAPHMAPLGKFLYVANDAAESELLMRFIRLLEPKFIFTTRHFEVPVFEAGEPGARFERRLVFIITKVTEDWLVVLSEQAPREGEMTVPIADFRPDSGDTHSRFYEADSRLVLRTPEFFSPKVGRRVVERHYPESAHEMEPVYRQEFAGAKVVHPNIVLTADGRIVGATLQKTRIDNISEKFRRGDAADIAYFDPSTVTFEKLSGRSVLIGCISTHNFGHFVTEAPPKLILLRFFDDLEVDQIIVPKCFARFAREACEVFGIDGLRMKILEDGLECESLVHFHLDWRNVHAIMPQIAKAAEVFNQSDSEESNNLIYLARSDATNRRILNEDEVIACVESRGFDVVLGSKLSFAEEIHRLRRARVIVSAPGQNTSSVMFSRRNSILIELVPDAWAQSRSTDWIHRELWRLCASKGLRYGIVIGKTFEWSGDIHHDIFANFLVDTEQLRIVLDQALAAI